MDQRVRFVRKLTKKLRVDPGRTVDLGRDFDPRATVGSVTRSEAEAMLAQEVDLLTEYQDRLFAGASSSVLVVLQGPDASGKDSTIKNVMRGVNPQGVDVRSFEKPSSEELRHDFLWRCQQVLPERGRIGVFNRSYYEEVLVVRVHPDLLARQRLRGVSAGKGLWSRRYRAINDWERYIVENGTRVVKILLNLSKAEQADRLLRRIEDPGKHWKFSADDIRDRRRWDEYQRAYGAMLGNTSTDWAPWYVVPADRKWFARLATAAILVQTLVDLDPQYPDLEPGALEQMAEARQELSAELGGSKKRSTRS